MAKPSKLGSDDYEKIGREIEDLLIKNYIDALHSTPRQIWNSFTRGVFAGLGGVIGATVGVAVLLYILQAFGSHLPYVGPYLKDLSETIRNR